MASTDGSPWFYPDRVSAAPGDTVSIHASGPGGPCRLIARRIGAKETVCADYPGIEVGTHPIPEHADALGCDWPASFSFTVGEDWPRHARSAHRGCTTGSGAQLIVSLHSTG